MKGLLEGGPLHGLVVREVSAEVLERGVRLNKTGTYEPAGRLESGLFLLRWKRDKEAA